MHFQCSACGHIFYLPASTCPKCGIRFAGERQIGARWPGSGWENFRELIQILLSVGAAILVVSVAIAIAISVAFRGRVRNQRLFNASAAGDLVEMSRQLRLGADVNGGRAEKDEGSTPLIDAAQAGQSEAVKLLLSKGARVHAINDDGNTAMSLAASRGSEDIVMLLLGADGSDVKSIVRAHRSLIQHPSICFLEAIPPDKLKLAVEAYAPFPATERPLALIDSPPGENGMLVTNEAVYARKTGEKPARFPLRSISSVRFVGDASSAGLEINGTQVLRGSKSRRQALILFNDMLIGITTQLRSTSGQPAQ